MDSGHVCLFELELKDFGLMNLNIDMKIETRYSL